MIMFLASIIIQSAFFNVSRQRQIVSINTLSHPRQWIYRSSKLKVTGSTANTLYLNVLLSSKSFIVTTGTSGKIFLYSLNICKWWNQFTEDYASKEKEKFLFRKNCSVSEGNLKRKDKGDDVCQTCTTVILPLCCLHISRGEYSKKMNYMPPPPLVK